MSQTYSGAWKRSTAYVQDDGTQVPTHTVDPAHGVRDLAADPRQDSDAPSAALLSGDGESIVGDLGNYPGADWWGDAIAGSSVDMTDTLSHEKGPAATGADVEAYRAEPDVQFFDERYTVQREAGDVTGGSRSLINPNAVLRGRNGNAVNSPDVSPDVVDDTWYNVTRRMLLRNLRQHERRVVELPTADTLVEKPAMTGSHGSPVPFLARMLPGVDARPTTRRIPEPFSQSVTRDEYAATEAPVSDVWVM